MNILIYKTQPRLVFYSLGNIYKFFESSKECADEIKLISSSPMKIHFDSKTNYTMSMVEIIFKGDHYYTMKPAKGKKLDIYDNDKNFQLAGRCLNIFHMLSQKEEKNKSFLYGDFIADHLFIDNNEKKITLIDPGNGFGINGNIEIDLARFIVDLISKKNFNLFILKNKIQYLIEGYGKKKN